MGNSNSRIDRFYGNYEKSFERIEKDVERLKARAVVRSQRKSSLTRWFAVLVILAFSIAAGIIYQVQQQPAGTYTYQQHFNRVGAALALPGAAFVLQWGAVLVLSLLEGRDAKKLKNLEAAKRSMIKELKDMSRFDKIKSLIDKFDPDVRAMQLAAAAAMAAGNQRGHMLAGAAGQPGNRLQQQQQQRQYLQQQRQGQGQMPALLMKGSGQVAGAAALAVAGAGKAIMPLFDKLATSLISDNPVLVEDLRRAQMQLQDAEMRMVGAVHESYGVKLENIGLKQRLVELEKQLDLPPSFDVEALQEQLQQQQQAQQQLPWVMQQCAQAGGGVLPMAGDGSGYMGLAQSGSSPMLNGGGSGGHNSWPGGAGEGANSSSGWGGEAGVMQVLQQGAISAPDTPCVSTQQQEQQEQEQQAGSGKGVDVASGAADAGCVMGEGLHGCEGDGQVVMQGAAGLRQRKGAGAAE